MTKMPYSRPEGFEKEKKDCTIRALSLASNIAYVDVHAAFKRVGRKDGHGLKGTKKKLQEVCKILNIEAKQIKRSGSLDRLKKEYPTENIFCLRRGHAFAIINGIAHDEDKNVHIKGAWIIKKKDEGKMIIEKRIKYVLTSAMV